MSGLITGVVHSGITVKDLSVSIPFYRDILGLEIVREEDIKKTRFDILSVPGGAVKCVIMGIPGTGQKFELIQYFSPRPLFDYGTPVNSIGCIHIAFRVDDLDAVMERMKDKDVHFVSRYYEHIQDGPQKGMKWIYLKGPDGENIEFIQEPEQYEDGKY